MEVVLAIASVMVILLHMIVSSPSSYCCCSTCTPSSSFYYYVVTRDATMVEPHTQTKKIDTPKVMEVVVANIGTMVVLLHATSSPSPSSPSCYYIVVAT